MNNTSLHVSSNNYYMVKMVLFSRNQFSIISSICGIVPILFIGPTYDKHISKLNLEKQIDKNNK